MIGFRILLGAVGLLCIITGEAARGRGLRDWHMVLTLVGLVELVAACTL